MSNVMATIEKVVKTYPIDGADNIEMTQVLDYHVVTKKNEFHQNDFIIYVRVDSILPDGLSEINKLRYSELKKTLKTSENVAEIELEMSEIISNNTRPEFEFLRKDKFTIKAKKYNKFKDSFGNSIISQGIIFPMSIIDIVPEEGLDVTILLGITKVVEDEEEIITTEKQNRFMTYLGFRFLHKLFAPKKISGNWESFLPRKSDEENVQKIFTSIVSNHGRGGYVVSEKMEGQNISFYRLKRKNIFGFGKVHYGVCSRNRHLPRNDGSDFWTAIEKNNFQSKLEMTNMNVLVRGERCAPRVQNNIYKFPDDRIFIFDVWMIDEKRFLNYDEMIEFCSKYGFETVPFLDVEYTLPETVTELLNYSNGVSAMFKTKREGIVIRKRDNYNISFKVKSPEYLVK